jgi:hypothetical protein
MKPHTLAHKGAKCVRERVKKMAKLVLGKNQLETLEEMMNLAINFLEGVEEYKADQKKYETVRDAIQTQKIKQAIKAGN